MDNYRIEGYLIGYSVDTDTITLIVQAMVVSGNLHKATLAIKHNLQSPPTAEQLKELDRRIESGKWFALNINDKGGA